MFFSFFVVALISSLFCHQSQAFNAGMGGMGGKRQFESCVEVTSHLVIQKDIIWLLHKTVI